MIQARCRSGRYADSVRLKTVPSNPRATIASCAESVADYEEDQADPIASRKHLAQLCVALLPRTRAKILPCHGEHVEGDEPQPLDRGGMAGEHCAGDGREVLSRPTVCALRRRPIRRQIRFRARRRPMAPAAVPTDRAVRCRGETRRVPLPHRRAGLTRARVQRLSLRQRPEREWMGGAGGSGYG